MCKVNNLVGELPRKQVIEAIRKVKIYELTRDWSAVKACRLHSFSLKSFFFFFIFTFSSSKSGNIVIQEVENFNEISITFSTC